MVCVISTSEARRNLVSEHNYYVYILTNWNNKVMYVGVTNNLERRVYEHKNKLISGFTKKYNINKLVYFEHTSDVKSAIEREKEIKKWRREKKNNLVITLNPEWKDLTMEWDKISPRFARRNDMEAKSK
jgi:putative endonuclease